MRAKAQGAPRRRFLIFPFALLAAAAAVHGVYWAVMAGEIRKGADDWIAAYEAAGYVIDHDGLQVRGYPYRFSLRAQRPQITAPPDEGGWSAHLEAAAATAQFYNLDHWIVTLDGAADFITRADGAPARYRVTTQEARISLAGANNAGRRIGADLLGFEVETLEGPHPVLSRVERLALNARLSGDDALAVRLQIEGVAFNAAVLGDALAGAFGETVQLLRADARVTKWDALAAQGDPGAWSRAGGALTLNRSQLEWGPAYVMGEGEIALDALMRPAGRLSVVVSDPDSLINALTGAGMVHEEQGDALRLAAMMAPRREGGIALPFRLQNGGLFLGPARIGNFDPVQ